MRKPAPEVGFKKYDTRGRSGGKRTVGVRVNADPGETTPLPHDEKAERLRDALVNWKAANDALRAAQNEGITPEPTEVDLKGVGYID